MGVNTKILGLRAQEPGLGPGPGGGVYHLGEASIHGCMSLSDIQISKLMVSFFFYNYTDLSCSTTTTTTLDQPTLLYDLNLNPQPAAQVEVD